MRRGQRRARLTARDDGLEGRRDDVRVDADAPQDGVADGALEVRRRLGVTTGRERVLVVVEDAYVDAVRRRAPSQNAAIGPLPEPSSVTVAAPPASSTTTERESTASTAEDWASERNANRPQARVGVREVLVHERRPHLARARPRRRRCRSGPGSPGENSICSRRGRSRLCSVFMMYATPPLPLWLLTRITASYVRPRSLGSIGRYGTAHGISSTVLPAAAASRSRCSKPFLMASWCDPENAVKTRSPP